MNKTDKLKKEAIKRMKALELLPECINAFKSSNEIWISEKNGALFELSEQKEILEKIKEFEKTHNTLVYHTIKTVTEYGTLISFLYVSCYEEEWGLDWKDMEENLVCCYVENLECPWCSEIGLIEYEKVNGGLIRIV